MPGCAGFIALGGVLVFAGRTHAGLIVLGSWIAGLGVLGLVGRALRDHGEAGRGPRGRIDAARLDGAPATVLREHPAQGWLAAVVTAYPGLLVISAPLGWRHLDAGLQVVACMIAAPFFVMAVGQVRRASRAGVWLTPSEVVVRGGSQVQRVRWVDVARVRGYDSGRCRVVELLAADISAVRIVGRSRLDRVLTGSGRITVFTQFTALDATALARVLLHFVQTSQTQILGTPAGPYHVRALVSR
jgi:hypothetical protein